MGTAIGSFLQPVRYSLRLLDDMYEPTRHCEVSTACSKPSAAPSDYPCTEQAVKTPQGEKKVKSPQNQVSVIPLLKIIHRFPTPFRK